MAIRTSASTCGIDGRPGRGDQAKDDRRHRRGMGKDRDQDKDRPGCPACPAVKAAVRLDRAGKGVDAAKALPGAGRRFGFGQAVGKRLGHQVIVMIAKFGKITADGTGPDTGTQQALAQFGQGIRHDADPPGHYGSRR